MVVLPEMAGLFRPGDKQEKSAIFCCSKCQSKRTVKAGKTIPKCSKCNEYTYWIKYVEL